MTLHSLDSPLHYPRECPLQSLPTDLLRPNYIYSFLLLIRDLLYNYKKGIIVVAPLCGWEEGPKGKRGLLGPLGNRGTVSVPNFQCGRR